VVGICVHCMRQRRVSCVQNGYRRRRVQIDNANDANSAAATIPPLTPVASCSIVGSLRDKQGASANKYVRLRGRPYIHTCRGRATRTRRQWRRLASIGNTCRRAPIRPILGFWGAKFPKMGDSLPRTPINHRAKFDTASFILAGEIRNRTNKHTVKNRQTVTDMSIVCLSACVDH